MAKLPSILIITSKGENIMIDYLTAYHCLSVNPSRTDKVIIELKKLGLEVVNIKEYISRKSNQREKALTGQSRVKIERPMFTGYLFYRGHNVARPILAIKGVIEIITNRPNYSPIAPKVIWDLIAAQNKGETDRTKLIKEQLSKMIGVKYEINGGAFDGIEAVITAVNDDGQAMGEIEFMGKKQVIPIGNIG